jgi:hypothetical protein
MSSLRSAMRNLPGLALALLLLGGCASLNSLSSEVSTYGPWPADRMPAGYSFERLPSQQARPERQQQLEDAARGALEAAGFHATDAADAQYLVQVGARVTSNDPWIYNEPLFFRGGYRYGRGRWDGYGYGRWGWGWGGPWGMAGYPITPTFGREVALLIRDHHTGQLLYEARASNNGPSPSIDPLLAAMFVAAMKDFPATGPNPRTVTVSTAPAPP